MLGALFALALSRCAVPNGSMARPVAPAAKEAMLVSGGAFVPLAHASHSDVNNTAISTADKRREVFVIPHAGVMQAFGQGGYAGVDLALWTSAFSTGDYGGGDVLAIFVNPYLEFPFGASQRHLALTFDGGLGLLRTRTASGNRKTTSIPFFSPTLGIRGYLPTGFGGIVLSQQIGSGLITAAAPGSIAYDLPIPIAASTLHIFPELRWDPTWINDAPATLSWIILSGGLTFALEY